MIDGNFIVSLTSIGLAVIGLVSGVIIYVIRLEGKAKQTEQALQEALKLVNKDLTHAKEYIDHLIDEGKNFKLIQGGFQNAQIAMQVSIARIEEKQDATIQTLSEMKELLKKAS